MKPKLSLSCQVNFKWPLIELSINHAFCDGKCLFHVYGEFIAFLDQIVSGKGKKQFLKFVFLPSQAVNVPVSLPFLNILPLAPLRKCSASEYPAVSTLKPAEVLPGQIMEYQTVM